MNSNLFILFTLFLNKTNYFVKENSTQTLQLCQFFVIIVESESVLEAMCGGRGWMWSVEWKVRDRVAGHLIAEPGCGLESIEFN